MTGIIEVKNLYKNFKIRTNKNILTGFFNPKYQVVEAVNDISFEVKEGEALAFLGPNGAGKTTTTKMLTGLVYPTSGQIKVMGYTPFDRKKDFLMKIGLVMGNKTGLSWDLTGMQAFDFIKSIYEIDEQQFKKTLNGLCEIMDVSKHLNKQIRRLSLGERMKMELIGAILHNPKILFLDEPTIGLDITAKKNIRKFLKDLQKKSNITVILTSHDMDDIETVCDRAVIINKGQKVFDNDLHNLVNEYNKEKYIKVYFEELPSTQNNFSPARIEKIESDSIVFAVPKEDTPKFISHIIEKFKIIDLDIVAVPLEEMIEDIFKKSSQVSSIVS